MLLARYDDKYKNLVGCDEAGRGCLAGPVVASAVLLPEDYSNSALDDSKKLSAKLREQLRHDIMQNAMSIKNRRRH